MPLVRTANLTRASPNNPLVSFRLKLRSKSAFMNYNKHTILHTRWRASQQSCSSCSSDGSDRTAVSGGVCSQQLVTHRLRCSVEKTVQISQMRCARWQGRGRRHTAQQSCQSRWTITYTNIIWATSNFHPYTWWVQLAPSEQLGERLGCMQNCYL